MVNSYNPDVLNCIANLSNDEVFTPPSLANQVLDLLPQELFRSPKTRFLDPFTKSGVFLREIVKRLDKGLEDQIPDRQSRIDHIMHNQVYGIACTELTALLARRSIYCSKTANGRFAVSRFDNPEGNIRYEAIQHSWVGGKCRFCGASQLVYDRGTDAEQYAYQFIHTDNPSQLTGNMTFDVIIGNPPYQLEDGGGRESAAIPLYNLFVEQSMKLNPRYLVMIIPARWYTGGRGLDYFRDLMINDHRLKEIHDFPETKDCFPGLNIRGGVCYFLWDNNYNGMCHVYNHIKENVDYRLRPTRIEGTDVFIRYNRSISILNKVSEFKEESLSNYVSVSRPFGMRSNFIEFDTIKKNPSDIKLYRFGQTGYINRNHITRSSELINKWKVLVSKASPGGDEYPHMIVSQPIISEPHSVCTETYLVIKDVESKEEAINLVSYIKTRFFRFMMSLIKNTQNISRGSYQFVPFQDFSHPWTDEMLYKKYGLSEDEIAFIESMIRPME